MLRDIRITLHDIFGYLLPGSVLLAAIAILFWTIFFPRTPLAFIQLTIEGWVLVLLLAYFSGHMTHALANLLRKFFPSSESLVLLKGRKNKIPDAIFQAAESKVSTILNIDLKNISAEWLFRICDETVAQYGVTKDREIFQYRQGFYRGSSVSFLILSLSLILRTVVPGASINTSDSSQPISLSILLFLILISLTGFLLSYLRFRRFALYRVSRAIIGFLALQGSKKLLE